MPVWVSKAERMLVFVKGNEVALRNHVWCYEYESSWFLAKMQFS